MMSTWLHVDIMAIVCSRNPGTQDLEPAHAPFQGDGPSISQVTLSRVSFAQQWKCQFNVKEGELQVNIHKQGSPFKTQMLKEQQAQDSDTGKENPLIGKQTGEEGRDSARTGLLERSSNKN
jgi:hypothetical protein